MQDLADLAGVSRATASRALSDSPLISARTKQKIRQLAERHGYRVNQRARDFRLQKTRVIGVVFMLDTQSDQHMSDPFFLEMLGGIADTLAQHDYDLLLAHAPVRDFVELMDSRVARQSDGMIFIGQGKQHAALNELARGGKPMVVWGGAVDDKDYVLVGSDNRIGGYTATRHLLDLGRRRIAFFGNTDNPEISARHQGYLDALREARLSADPSLTVDVPFDIAHARAVASDVLDSGGDFDAIVCASDVIAMAAISTYTKLGLRVPEDIAVVGYDDIALAAYGSPALTTVRQGIQWAGRVLVESVLGLIDGDDVRDTTLSSELIVRQSSGSPEGDAQ